MCSHTMSPHSSTLHLPGRSSRLAGGPGGPSSSLLNPKIQRQRRPTAPLAESASTTPTTPTPGQKRQAAVRSTFALKRSTDKRIAAAQATLCSHSPMDPNDLRAAAAILQPAHWDEVALERNLADLCAYPLCRQSSLSPSVTSIVLGPNGHQSHDTPAALSKLQPWTPVTASQLALLPATAELASFCSRKCWLKSSFIRLQLSHDPLYLRPANAKPVSILLAEDEDAHHLALPEQVSASSSLVSYIDDMLAQAAASFSSAKTSSSVPVTENQPDPTAIIPFERVDSYGIDGHSTKADNGARRMVASRTRSRAAATVRCAAPFTIVTAAFSGVTPKACRLISSPVQPPNGAHVAKPRPNPGDHADDMVSFNLENKLQRELFLQRFEAIVVPAIALLDLDHEVSHNVMALALELARSMRPTSCAVSLLSSDSGYSWLFCLVIVWGACYPNPSLHFHVFKSQAWSILLQEVIWPAIGQDSAIGHVVDEHGIDIVERVGRFVFSE